MAGLAGDNTIEVPVRSDIGRYVADMRRAADVTDEFGDTVDRTTRETGKLGPATRKAAGDVDSLERSGKRSKVTFDGASQKVENFGRKATIMSVAVAGAAVAAVKLGADYEREFSKITGLVGIAADEVAVMEKATLGLAGRTAQAPQDLAKAMFTLQSAGLRGETAMSALEQSAQLAAGGMGDVGTIAQATTSILDQYAKKGVDAGDAADFLAATARAGNFEASQLAGSLGKVLPVSSQLDISLSDVGGTIALLTRGNGNAAESSTQLAAAMRVLIAPSAEASKILGEAGLTMQDIKDTAAGPGGLVAALEQMYEATGRNDEQFARMLGSSEAVSAAFQILNADAAALDGTYGALTERTGVAAEVFDAAAATSGFAMEQAMTRIKVAAIEAGGAIGPELAGIAEDMSGFVLDAVDWWKDLPPEVQNVAVSLGKVALAAGPAALALGKAGQAIAAMNPWAVGATIAIAGLVAGARILEEVFKTDLDRAIESIGDATEALTESLIEQGPAAGVTESAIEPLIDRYNELAAAARDASAAVDEGPTEPALATFYRELNDTAKDGVDLLIDYAGGIDLVEKQFAAGARPVDVFGRAVAKINADFGYGSDQAVLASESVDGLAAALNDSAEAMEADARARFDNIAGLTAYEERVRDVAHSLEESGRSASPFIDAQRVVNQQMIDFAVVADDYTTSADDVTAATEDSTEAADISALAFEDLTGEVEELEEQLTPLEQALEDVTDELRDQYEAQTDLSGAVEAHRQMIEGLYGPQQRLDEALEESRRLYEAMTDAVPNTVAELWEFGEAHRDVALLMAETGSTSDEVIAFLAAQETAFREFGAQMGLTEAEIDTFVETWLQVPDSSVKTMTVAADTAQARSELYGITSTYWRADIAVLLNSGDYNAVEAALSRLARSRAVAISPTYGAADHGSFGSPPPPTPTYTYNLPEPEDLSGFGVTYANGQGGGWGGIFHSGGVAGRDFNAHRGRLGADEVPAVLQTGERVLSRQDTAWFDRMFLTPASSAGGGSNITVGPGAVQVDIVGAAVTEADVEAIVERGNRDLVDQINTTLGRGR